ncbi:MAG: zinc-dependent metalloprotease [Planctomycetota bacterium]
MQVQSPRLRKGLLLAAALLLPGIAAAQGSLPFPLHSVEGATEKLGEAVLSTDLDDIEALTQLKTVTLTGVPLPNGTSISLELERLNLTRRRFGVHVDGALVPDLIDGLDLSVWKGRIAGDDHSDVMLGFSNAGSRGWIRSRDGLVHLLTMPHEDGSWRAAPGVLVTEEDLNLQGLFHRGGCKALPPSAPPAPRPVSQGSATSQIMIQETICLRECTVAMETDYQLFQRFNNVNAATAYLTTLLSFISDRYEAQAETALTFPYLQLYTNSNDPWVTPDTGGDAGDMLNEFVSAWQGNVPMGAALGHMMSGASLGGGVAFLGGLCSSTANFGVSGNINGNVNFPVVQSPTNWDFLVVAHEIGHNFNSPHTHDFCPPIDQCAASSAFGQCQSTSVCANTGTIMSYCHTCPGGTNNMTTYFHPLTAELMTVRSASCNPIALEVQVFAPDVATELVPTQTRIQSVVGTLLSGTMSYRLSGSTTAASVPMTSQGGGAWVADLPAVLCGQVVEYWFDFDVAGLGEFTAPVGAPGQVYSAVGGFESVAFTDDFETDQGWGTTTLGATGGRWERGVPVNDPNWAYGPSADYDLSGRCFLTENRPGSSDVDNGAVQLISPLLDLSEPNVALSYAYFLRLTHVTGADKLIVEASSAGGPYVELNRHDDDVGQDWQLVTLTQADLVAAGLTLGPQVRLRFTANDASLPSVVEAGIDAVTVRSIDCLTVGTVYCDPAVANSTGAPATIVAEGSDLVADNDVTLTIESLPPNTVGYFLTSQTQGFVANAGGSQGNLCLGGSIGRYINSVLSSGPAGTYSLQLDLTAVPQPTGFVGVTAGETWNFQSWYRDQLLGFPSSNFTEAIEILFQ